MIDIAHRRRLVALLTEAAELEHALMCQYLYAALSMKRRVEEGEEGGDLVGRDAFAERPYPHREPGVRDRVPVLASAEQARPEMGGQGAAGAEGVVVEGEHLNGPGQTRRCQIAGSRRQLNTERTTIRSVSDL